jgi:hypothetical protein
VISLDTRMNISATFSFAYSTQSDKFHALNAPKAIETCDEYRHETVPLSEGHTELWRNLPTYSRNHTPSNLIALYLYYLTWKATPLNILL